MTEFDDEFPVGGGKLEFIREPSGGVSTLTSGTSFRRYYGSSVGRFMSADDPFVGWQLKDARQFLGALRKSRVQQGRPKPYRPVDNKCHKNQNGLLMMRLIVIFGLLCEPLVAQEIHRFIPTSQVVRVASMAAADEGYKVGSGGVYLDELTESRII